MAARAIRPPPAVLVVARALRAMPDCTVTPERAALRPWDTVLIALRADDRALTGDVTMFVLADRLGRETTALGVNALRPDETTPPPDRDDTTGVTTADRGPDTVVVDRAAVSDVFDERVAVLVVAPDRVAVLPLRIAACATPIHIKPHTKKGSILLIPLYYYTV